MKLNVDTGQRKSLTGRAKQFLREGRKFGRFGSLAGASAALPIVGGAMLLGTIHQISPWLQANDNVGVALFVAAMIVFAGFALLTTNVLGIVSGWAFDFPTGLAAMALGICGAACLTYFAAKRMTGKQLENFIEQKPKARILRRALLQDSLLQTIIIVALLRLTPAMPFSMTNLLMATAGVPLKSFLVGTFFGMLPRSAAVVYVGSELSELNFSQPTEIWVILPGITVTILTLIVIGYLSKRALSKYTRLETAQYQRI